MQNHVNRDEFIQIAIVVKDIYKAAEKWASVLGVPVPEVRENPPVKDPNLSYRGKEAFYGLKVACIDMGSFVIELHEPDENDSTFREYLDKHGNGVHHLGFEVGRRRNDVVKEFEEEGYALRTVGFYPGSSWTIVDTEEDLGVNLNIKPIA